MPMSFSPVADLFVRSIKTMLGDATAVAVEQLENRSMLAGSPLPTISQLESPTNTVVRFETNQGDFDVELFNGAAPNTVANFLNYVRSGRYDQTFVQRSNRVNDPGQLGGIGVLQAGGRWRWPVRAIPTVRRVSSLSTRWPMRHWTRRTTDLRYLGA
jgi:hypothetical protein